MTIRETFSRLPIVALAGLVACGGITELTATSKTFDPGSERSVIVTLVDQVMRDLSRRNLLP